MTIIDSQDREKIDLKIVIVGILLLSGIIYWIYSTVIHFQTMNQIREAGEMRSDIQSNFIWSMHHYKNNIVKACNFENIQSATQSEDFQNMNHVLKLNTQLQRQGKYVEKVEIYPTSNLQQCVVTTYFRKNPNVSKDIAGKYISSRYDIKAERYYCTTNILNRRLVKACQRVSENR